MFYGYRYNVAHGQHAVERLRQLFARIFDYDLAPLMLDYGINVRARRSHPRLLFLHGTTWASKHWPEERWCDLAEKAVQAGFHVLLPHGNRLEEHRAHRIADATNTKARSGRDVRSGDERQVDVLPSGTLSELISEMSTCAGVVGVDTGLGHLAVAMEIPMIGIYGATNPVLTGPFGPRQEIVVSDNLTCIPCLKKECRYPRTDEWGKIHPPCYQDITADLVFDRLSSVMEEQR
jgi:heptosyltransferase-1